MTETEMIETELAYDLFCGAGGATLGITQTGLYHVIGYDNWPLAVETHHLNGYAAKVRDLSKKSPKTKRKPGLIWASPPCQPFSNAINQSGQWDERDGFPHYLRILEENMPRLTVLENVAGLTYKRHADYLATIIESIRALGYQVDWRLLDASDYRIPQVRRRLIIIGRLDGKPRWPKVSEEKVTVGQALKTNGKKNPPGCVVKYLKNPIFHGGFRGSLLYNGRGRPLDLDRPSFTISASSGNHIHWFDTKHTSEAYYEHLKAGGKVRTGKTVKGSRRLTVEQMARLQGFPKDFEFAGPPSQQIKQIGNAVPPRLARLIVKKNAA